MRDEGREEDWVFGCVRGEWIEEKIGVKCDGSLTIEIVPYRIGCSCFAHALRHKLASRGQTTHLDELKLCIYAPIQLIL